MSKILWLLCSCVFLTTILEAQDNNNNLSEKLAGKPSLNAAYVENIPKIDGVLDEPEWQTAIPATDFTQFRPNPGNPASQSTEVRVLYSTEGIYVGAMCYDTAPDSILSQLSVRDNIGATNTDLFSVYIDGMLTLQNDFTFTVTAAGVQADASSEDYVWDAVWKSEVKVVDNGWVIEIEIPYSQLRFPRSNEQTWGINFSRRIRRLREESYWSPIDPKQDNFVQLEGLLKGIERIKPPVRLSLTPYVATYLNHQDDGDPTTKDWKPSISAGADLKYGINESFTLDVALVPDFGDVQSDNLQFNLGPFEIFYAERRPFFTEGVELFNRAGIFYSRRVGSRPTRYNIASGMLDSAEVITKNVERPQLINALKVSGRTKKGLGIGVFNALTAPSNTHIEDTLSGEKRKFRTEPFTNYNVLVFDQQFGKNSYVSLINTSVIRFGSFTDAVVTGTAFKVVDKNNKYGTAGNASLSQQFLDTLLYTDRYQNGYKYNVSFQKFSGQFRFGVAQQTISKNYNINDLGYSARTNYVNSNGWVSYNIYKPFSVFMNMWMSFDASHEMLYNPNKFMRIQFGGDWGATYKNFLSTGLDFRVEPIGYNDYFEARTDGQVWDKPTWTRIGGWFSSDYRKAFALDGRCSYRRFWGSGAWKNSDVIQGVLSPLIRFSDRVNTVLENNTTVRLNSIGYVTKTTGVKGEESIIFGRRFRKDIISTITLNYLFNSKMSLSFRLRHYWATVEYLEMYDLQQDGSLESSAYAGSHDQNFNAFNVDLIYRWRFAPGSELNVVWKNSVLEFGDQPKDNFFTNFGEMFEGNQSNQFSIKALYYLDFFRLLKKKRRGQRLGE
ncbi:MAG: carbohydrate binding family 9 domain-containing protein [Aureispira sp.]|nr:carbohydrate binding family 9 domain-containing protein [Aureispira sp.]